MAGPDTYLETYLQELLEIRSSGEATQETSYYPPLRDLLNSVGAELKPKVRCILTLKNRGAGLPDGGLFTKDQFQRMKDSEPMPGQKPGRGAIEVKSTKDDAWITAAGEQVTKYWREYGQVLVTNYRDFVLLGRDAEGAPVRLGSYRLAPDERSFWRLAGQPRKAAQEQGARFLDFLKLAILSPATLVAPKDVAWVLAFYAREAKARIEAKSQLPALANIRAALEQALGLKFEGDKGEHFFRSSLVQTLFYGVFSAWVLWSKQHSSAAGKPQKQSGLFSAPKFDWRLAQWSLRVPMIKVLFEQVATPGQLEPLGLIEVLDWTASALNRIDRAEFFTRFQEQEAVQYFYEPFLEAFDADLRKELGVWYTPVEIVKYMVARTHTVLREELNLEDGLADPNVYVLDPGCGTGAYLVEVLKTIADTLKAKGDDALAAQDVKQAAMHRVFGFELLPAPFVISHLQLGLLLQNLGAPLAESDSERVGVYLTNSLTGWEPPKDAKQHLMFKEMEDERDAADAVKHHDKILVVIGNPPYNAFAGVSPAEEKGLVDPYKEGLISKWGIKKFNLDDLYVRFFRLAERRITEMTGRGVVCYISNSSYLNGQSFVVMRKRFINGFNKMWIDCMNGDSRETGKVDPDGNPDPSVFSTQLNRAGIRKGTAVAVLVREGSRGSQASVSFRNFWGAEKRGKLLQSLTHVPFGNDYEPLSPTPDNFFSFRPGISGTEYAEWPSLIDLASVTILQGLDEDRANALIEIDDKRLEQRMRRYYDRDLEWTDFATQQNGLARSSAGFDPVKVRAKTIKREPFLQSNIMRYLFRPLDVRWCYYTTAPSIWKRSRPELGNRVKAGNAFVVTRPAGVAEPEGVPFLVVDSLVARDSLRGHAVAFPIHDKIEQDTCDQATMPARADAPHVRGNLSERASEYLTGLAPGDPAWDCAGSLWTHAVAIGYSPAYLGGNVADIRRDWPRIPLPATKDALLKSAMLGERVAALLNTEADVKGVTSGAIRDELKVIGNITAVQGKLEDPAHDLLIDAGWGHGGKEGITMPGKGKLIERDYTGAEREAVVAGAAGLGLTPEQAFAQLGESTCDVYLNSHAYWKSIPAKVWDYYIGGYQVIKKWLSYREGKLLGRALTTDEARYVTAMARRLAALCLLQPELDANYAAVKADTYAWPKG